MVEASRIERIARAISLSKGERPDTDFDKSPNWHKYLNEAEDTLALHDEHQSTNWGEFFIDDD